LDLGENLFQN